MKRTWKQISSLLLAFCMVFTMLPTAAFAEMIDVDSGMPLGGSGTITTFADISDDVVEQVVEIGTTEDKLTLPNELAVTVVTGSAVTLVMDSGVTNVTTVAVSSWTSDPTYDGDKAGEYIFRPVLTLADGLSIAVDATVPQITVTVQEAPALLSIRGAESGAFKVEGGDAYATLEEAAAAVPFGGTITMLQDVTVKKPSYFDYGITLSENKDYTIDFGGYTLNSLDNSRIRLFLIRINRGSVILKNGTIRAKKDNLQGLSPDAVAVDGETTTVDIMNMTIYGCNNALVGENGSTITLWSGKLESLLPPTPAINGQVVLAPNSKASPASWKNATTVTVTAAQDTTPPTIIARAIRTGETTANLSVTASERGWVYYLPQDANGTVPNREQVKSEGAYLGMTDTSGVLSGAILTIPAETVQIYVVVEDWAGNISLPATGLPIITAELPEIRTQAADASYIIGDSAQPLTVAVSDISDGGTLSYEWYKNTANSTEGGEQVGTNVASYTPDISSVGTHYYFVVVKNTNNNVNGDKVVAVTSSVAKVTVDVKRLTGINKTIYVKAGLDQPQNYTLDLKTLLPPGADPDKITSYEFGLFSSDGDVSVMQSQNINGNILTVTVKANATAGVKEEIGIVFNSDYYNISNANVTLHSTTKTPVKISGVTVESRVSDGSPISVSGTPVFTNAITGEIVEGLTPIYTWAKAISDGGSNLLLGAPSDPGYYTLTVAADGGESYEIMPLAIIFEITIAPVIFDDKKPVISSVTPSGTDVALEGGVVITFSEAMNTEIAGTVFFNDMELKGGGKWDLDGTTVFIAYDGLAKGTTYTVKISGFKDIAGNFMDDVTDGYTFTTDSDRFAVTLTSVGIDWRGSGFYKAGELVTIKAGRPYSGMRFKNWTSTPTVNFANASDPETSFTMPAGAVTVKAHFEVVPENLFLVSVLGEKNLAFEEIDFLDALGSRFPRIPAAVNLPNGTTKIGAKDVGVKSNVMLLGFSSSENLIEFMGGNQGPENIAFMSASMIEFYKQMTGIDFDPSATTPLAANGVTEIYLYAARENGDDQLYKITIGNISDTIPPVVTSVTPVGTGVAISGGVLINFSETMKTDEAGIVKLNSITLTGGQWNAPDQFIMPYSGLAYNTTYTVNISGFQDAAGNTMNAVTSGHTFTTVAGGGSSSGGGSSGSKPTVTPPAPDKPTIPTDAKTEVSGKVDAGGNAIIAVPEKSVTDAIKKAQDEARKNGNQDKGMAITIKATGTEKASGMITSLSAASIKALTSAGVKTLTIDCVPLTVTLDLRSLNTLLSAGGSVELSASKMENTKLSAEAQKAIGNRPIYQLSATAGGKEIKKFGGQISVAIPYTLGANEKSGNLYGVYVDDSGKVTWLMNSSYDANSKTLMFTTNHFSAFGIGYKQDAPNLTDIGSHWAKDDIEFVVNRGLLSGTSATTFSPNTAMTRGMFVTALGRLAKADVSTYKQSSFTDVENDAYYMGYIEWASKNNIVTGIGDRRFSPDQSITREQMAAIMQNYAKTVGVTLPKVHGENTFADSTKINAYAKDAVKTMQMAGIISGKNGNIFDPQGRATRAEVSAVLRRLVGLVISNDGIEKVPY